MGWAEPWIAKLQAGQAATFRPRGGSMAPRIRSGQLCTVAPFDRPIAVGDIVLCRIGRAEYLHIVSAIDGDRCQISNYRGHVDGWTSARNVFGRLIHTCD